MRSTKRTIQEVMGQTNLGGVDKIMGQYYKPVLLGPDDIDGSVNGPIVLTWWYSHDFGSGLKLMEHSWLGNSFVAQVEHCLRRGEETWGSRLVWAGDYADPVSEEEYSDNLYGLVSDRHENKKAESNIGISCRYLINHTLQEFVDKEKVPRDKEGWAIHPLPLLTADGNGRGGGDFIGSDPRELVGRWKCHVIEASDEPMYEELIFDLME